MRRLLQWLKGDPDSFVNGKVPALRKLLALTLISILFLTACTPPSYLTTALFAVQMAVEAATPIIEAHAGPQAAKILAYVNAALGAVETSATVLGRGPVTQAGADEIAAAWSKAVLDPNVLAGESPDVVAIITAISLASQAFVHQFTAGKQLAGAMAGRTPRSQPGVLPSVTFSRSDRSKLGEIQKRAVAQRAKVSAIQPKP